MSTYQVTMSYHQALEHGSVVKCCPIFQIEAFSNTEAALKVKSMCPRGLRLIGSLCRPEPHCDQYLTFDTEE